MSTSVVAPTPTPTIDLSTVRVSLDSPVSGFSHPYYPIYLNQRTEQGALSASFRVFASLDGQPEQAIDVNQHKLRVVPFLRYGQTAGAVPEPRRVTSSDNGRAEDRHSAIKVVAVDHQPQRDHLNTMSFRISSDCLSIGGFETTVHLRLLVLSPVDNVVLAFVDSSRFVVMTREFPAGQRMLAFLRDWGFPMHPDDVDTLQYMSREILTKTRCPLTSPQAPMVEDEQEPNPIAISMPNGRMMLTLRGMQAMSPGYK
jgi:hypothetical protein